MNKFFDIDIKDIYKKLDSGIKGLDDKEVKNRLKKYGKNELPKGKKESIFKIILNELLNPLEIILIIATFFSFIIGETIDAIVLLIIIDVDVVIGAFEEFKAKKDAESLINMIKVKTKVIRDNKTIEVDSSELVIGDIILLESGDKISADARIIECYNFQVDESALTGESTAIIKENKVLPQATPLSERVNMVFAGTNVRTGRCKAIVVATSLGTEIGAIANKVTTIKEEKSPLTIRVEKFVREISILILIVAIIIVIIFIFKKYPVGDIILNVVALSVSAMPEGLALAMTMALTIASKKMAKKNVIVKNLNAVESLGSCTVIATDKTGTLTVNEQTAKKIILKDGSTFTISGTGYNDVGEIKPIDNANIELAKEIAYLGLINNEAHLEKENDDWKYYGDSIDVAFLSLAKKLKLKDTANIVERIPYESVNQYSAVFYEKDGETYCTVKGSLEKVMEVSATKDLYKEQNKALTRDGYRVIAIANGKVKGTKKEDIKKLDFIGLVAFIDPIRKEVKKAIKDCNKAGIKVVMITGDHPLTATAIAKELGLVDNDSEVATGEDIAKIRKLSDEEFDKFVSCIKVFSRVTPLDKLEIVNSFKRQGEFVAVTGDGVNDAPAIKSANIGISMGSGTDVAKDTAGMIIVDDNFTSIVEGIREGRTAYSNIRKITLFLIACGLAEVAFFILSIIFNYDIPLLAIQLLWLNMVTDGLQDISLSFERTEQIVMEEKPRNPKESLLSGDLIRETLLLGVTISLIVFLVWAYMMNKNMDIIYARSVIMMLMVFIQNINVLNCISEKRSLFEMNLLNHPLALLITIGSIILQIVISKIPFIANILKIVPLPPLTIIILLLISSLVIVVFETHKFLVKKNYFRKVVG